MGHFPTEFSSILSSHGLRILHGRASTTGLFSDSNTRFSVLRNVVNNRAAARCVKLLDDHLYRLLTPMSSRIPRESISGMTVNYGESLPKTVRVKSAALQSKRDKSYRQASQLGLIGMMESPSLLAFAEAATGLKLEPRGVQALCYEHGDYAGPHNDHHPEVEDLKDGYIDLQVMFSNDAVKHQWLVYQHDWHFSRIQNLNLKGAVAVYKLPFWHYATPLTAKRGREAEARRWLLLSSFAILGRKPAAKPSG
jgi:hypothetical protein